MKRLVLIALLLVVIAPAPARAYTASCSALYATVLSDDPFQNGISPGYAFGVADFLAGLQCFVGNPQCECLKNVVRNNAQAVGTAFGNEIRACISRGEGDTPAFGAMLRALRPFCPW